MSYESGSWIHYTGVFVSTLSAAAAFTFVVRGAPLRHTCAWRLVFAFMFLAVDDGIAHASALAGLDPAGVLARIANMLAFDIAAYAIFLHTIYVLIPARVGRRST